MATKKAAPKVSQDKFLEGLPFGVGDKVLIRTVTMIQIGRVAGAGPDFLVLDQRRDEFLIPLDAYERWRKLRVIVE